MAISAAPRTPARFRNRRCRCRSGNWRANSAPRCSNAARRQVRLTGFGEAFALRVRDILRSVDELQDLARVSQDGRVGRLRIGVIPTVAPYLLPAIIGNLTHAYPGLDLHVRETVTGKLIGELAEGRIDAAIVALPVSEPSLTEVALFAEDFVLVRPGEDEGKPVPNGETLSKMRLLLLEEGHCFRDQALSFCNRHSAMPRELLDGSSLSTLVQMVSAGIGVTLDSGNGGCGRDALGAGLRRAVRESKTVADHRHDLAQDQPARQSAHCRFQKSCAARPPRCASSRSAGRRRDARA